ncbi:MAG: GGDEF domain-containing protein [Treponema sp.]|nr:GGDEF domain-containing protein [Treponema sp.]
MLLKVKKILGLESLHPDIQFFLDCANLRIARVVSVIVMILEAVTFSISFFFQVHNEVENPEQWINFHRILYVILFLAATQLCIYSFSHKTKKGNFSHAALSVSIVIFLVVLLVFAVLISLMDYMLNEQILVFITLEMFFACLFMIKPLFVFPIIIGSFGIFYYLMYIIAGVSAATKINYPIMMIFFILVNIVHYLQYLRIAKNTVVNHTLAEQLREASLYDPLTKLKNRNALNIDFEELKNKEVILMLTDIDDFKSYNDTKGHNFGDQLLFKFATIIQEIFGKEHCYRYGGDEYLVLLPKIPNEEFKKKIEACTSKIAGEFFFSGGYLSGLVTTQADLHNFINKADEKLYESKGSGKNKVIGF